MTDTVKDAEKDAEDQLIGEVLTKYMAAYNRDGAANIDDYLGGIPPALAAEAKDLATTWLVIKKEIAEGTCTPARCTPRAVRTFWPNMLVFVFTMVAFAALSVLVASISRLETENKRLQKLVDSAPATSR